MPARASLDEAARRVGADGLHVEEVASNELLHERMLAAGPWDLVFPSDYLVERLVGAAGLLPLDGLPLERLADWACAGTYDPGCHWSVPFAYGTTGYLTTHPTSSWCALLEPPMGVRVSMLDEVREVVGAALIFLGRDPNDVTPEALAGAREVLRRQRPAVVAYGSDDFVGPVARGEVAFAHAWSGPASHAVRQRSGLRYVVPDEGAILWVTTGAIPADAPRPELSMQLIAELMDPTLAACTTEENGYATPNDAARALLPAALRADLTMFPDDDTRSRCHALHDLGEAETRLLAIWPPR